MKVFRTIFIVADVCRCADDTYQIGLTHTFGIKIAIFTFQNGDCHCITRDIRYPDSGTIIVYFKTTWYPALLGRKRIQFIIRTIVAQIPSNHVMRVATLAVEINVQEIARVFFVVVFYVVVFYVDSIGRRRVEVALLGDEYFVKMTRFFVEVFLTLK